MSDPRYPIGKLEYTTPGNDATRAGWIQTIAEAPARLREALRGLSPAQIETPYREGGWTLRQVAHHLPESHMNGYVRFKLALTEDGPTIKPYDEARWSETADVPAAPIETSLALLDALHERWAILLRAMRGGDWDRKYVHPAYGKTFTLDHALALYEWHSRHHVAHVTSLRASRGW